jgi:TolC family type I secretion outer membrane protein
MVSFSTKPMVPRTNHWRMTISASGPRRRGIARAVASAIALTSTPAHADTLAQAIATAYDTNPDILAQRELLRAINERYLQARAQLGFTVDATASVQSQRAVVDSNLQTDNTVTAQTAAQSLSVIQPLYSGGRLHAALQAALANVFLNYQYVRRAQARVLTQVVTAYADVQRDQQIVAISTENVGLLQGQIDQTRAKLAVKAATLTDRDQGFARFAAAQAQLVVATARLRASESSYRAVVGQDPGKLEPVPALPDLAQTVDGFYALAEKSSPVLLSADFQERSSRAGILQAKAATRPSLALRGDVSRGPLLPYNGQLRNDNQTVRLVLNVPIYSSGANSARIRESRARNRSDIDLIESARRQVRLSVSQAYEQMRGSQQALDLYDQQVTAQAGVYKGTRIEERFALRSSLDILNAAQELNNARIARANAAHDSYVGEATLIAAAGKLSPATFGIETPMDPLAPDVQRLNDRDRIPWMMAVDALDAIGQSSVFDGVVMSDLHD